MMNCRSCKVSSDLQALGVLFREVCVCVCVDERFVVISSVVCRWSAAGQNSSFKLITETQTDSR